jgi:uncharacterized membrane protein
MLPGLKAALNYHPIFVHFPIVLWFAALLFELLAVWRTSDEMQRTASRMLYLGTLAAMVTALTGLVAEKSSGRGSTRGGNSSGVDAGIDKPRGSSLHFCLLCAAEFHHSIAKGDVAGPRRSRSVSYFWSRSWRAAGL